MKCRFCGGRGSVNLAIDQPEEKRVDCTFCNGSGFDKNAWYEEQRRRDYESEWSDYRNYTPDLGRL